MRQGGENSLGLAGMDNSGGLEPLAVPPCVAPALGDLGQEKYRLLCVGYVRRSLGAWALDCRVFIWAWN